MNKAWIAVGALVVATANCGGGVEAGTSTSTGNASSGGDLLCIPGQQSACACVGGAMGAQTCRADGSGFDPCLGCGETGSSGSASTGAGGASSSSGSGGEGHGGTASATSSTSATSSASGSTSTGGGCMTGPNLDLDQDGWTPTQGDCNDCDPLTNPAAIEGVGDATDEDCDGLVDNVLPSCDQGLALDDNDPQSAAKAVELCKVANGPKDWGVTSAKWVSPDGSPAPVSPEYDLGHGLLGAFGPNVHVQAGQTMLGLSSGTARQPTDPGYQDVGGFSKGFSSNSPPGFPKATPSCPGVVTGSPHDAVALEIALRAPSNAHGFSFDFNVFTYEWPEFSCSQFNDLFLALLSPVPAGLADGNISFDAQGDYIGPNSSLIEVCGCAVPPCMAGGKTFACDLGNQGLVDTGFTSTQGEDHGSSGWLVSTAPVTPNQAITIRWTTYDSGDAILDTTTLLDNWRWIVTPGVQVKTTRIQLPK